MCTEYSVTLHYPLKLYIILGVGVYKLLDIITVTLPGYASHAYRFSIAVYLHVVVGSKVNSYDSGRARRQNSASLAIAGRVRGPGFILRRSVFTGLSLSALTPSLLPSPPFLSSFPWIPPTPPPPPRPHPFTLLLSLFLVTPDL